MNPSSSNPSSSSQTLNMIRQHLGKCVFLTALCVTVYMGRLVYNLIALSAQTDYSQAYEPTTTQDKQGGKHNDAHVEVEICHKGQTITVDNSALDAHIKHGDTLGACSSTDNPKPEGSTTLCHQGQTLTVAGSTVAEYVQAGAILGACSVTVDNEPQTQVEIKQTSFYIYQNPFKKIEDRCMIKLAYIDKQGIKKIDGSKLNSIDIANLKNFILAKPLQDGQAMTTRQIVKLVKTMNQELGEPDSTALCGKKITIPVVKLINSKQSNKTTSN